MQGDYSAAATAAGHTQGGITGVSLLMPVWGYRFTSRFLEFCLPTLLAPNNIPALAREVPCRFILLSSENSIPLIQAHPTWQKLAQICTAEIQPIDDLITEANHTATITLAFERAIRQAGDTALSTCFILLMSDYIVADGSLRSVLAAMRGGAHGVLVGNFQVTAEEAVPLLRAGLVPGSAEIVIDPRQLMRWSLGHLHPATIANTVNVGLTHNAHTNRLFWRVDENCLIGRFYLMHAIAIRPEVIDFVVGSSWDYSFIPELCPSGRVITLTDSDDYLVVEMQARGYESDNLLPGSLTAAELAVGLAEWTTERHRKNVEQTLIFHAAEKPADLQKMISQSDQLVNEVRSLLVAPPIPHRAHPYWIGSLAINRWRSNRPLDRLDWQHILADRELTPPSNPAMRRLRGKLFGYRPAFTRLHPSWPDYALAVSALQESLATNGRVLLVAGDRRAFADWVARVAGDAATLSIDQLLTLSRAALVPLMATLDRCLLVLGEVELGYCDQLIERVLPLLKKGGKINVLVLNERPFEEAIWFGRAFAREAARLLPRNIDSVEVYYIPCSRNRWSIRGRIAALLPKVSASRLFQLPFALAAAVPTVLAAFVINLRSKPSRIPPLGIWSSVFATLCPTDGAHAALPQFGEDRIAVRGEACSRVTASRQERTGETSAIDEPQREAESEQLFSELARYRFVAKLIGYRHDVGEVGPVNPLGTRLVMKAVRQMTVYDVVAADRLRLALEDGLACQVRPHDILVGPLPKVHDFVYCIEGIQYFSRDEEGLFLRHLGSSLGHEFDFLLIGSPSQRASSAAASPSRQWVVPDATDSAPFRSGKQIYRRSGPELFALMQSYFRSVVMFSMVDDVAHPGIVPEAEFIFTLGCNKRG
jgi:hypothetical protein